MHQYAGFQLLAVQLCYQNDLFIVVSNNQHQLLFLYVLIH